MMSSRRATIPPEDYFFLKRAFGLIFLVLLLATGCVERRGVAGSGKNSLLDATIERFPLSPLTALVRFRTALPAKVTVTIKGQDGEDLTKGFKHAGTVHDIPILGLYPNSRNTVILRLESSDGTTESDTLQIRTTALPRKFRGMKILHRDSNNLAGGFYFILLYREFAGSREEGMLLSVDNYGKIRWAYLGDCGFWAKVLSTGRLLLPRPTRVSEARRMMRDGVEVFLSSVGWYSTLRSLSPAASSDGPESTASTQRTFLDKTRDWIIGLSPESWRENNTLAEIDLLGREQRLWKVDGYMFHHDCIELPNGNLLALAGTRESVEDLVIEIDKNSNTVVRVIDFKKILDDRRPPAPPHVSPPDDWLHLNALYLDSKDGSLVVSARNQSAVVKLTPDSLRLRWILGNHENWPVALQRYLLKPIGRDFEWAWGPHAPMQSTAQANRILLFDNGNLRGYAAPLRPEENFSRAVEYQLDGTNAGVQQVWQYGKERGNELYSPVVGSAVYLPNGNRLICFGAIAKDLSGNPVEWIQASKDSAGFENRNVKSSVRIIEVSGDTPANVYFELSYEDPSRTDYTGYLAYRAYKLGLY